MKTRYYIRLIVLLAALISDPALSRSLAKDCGEMPSERDVLPPNLILPDDARRILEKVWRRSPTFRDQCRRIARAPWVRIRVLFAMKRNEPYGALTTVKKHEHGFTVSTIKIFITGRYVERIGHEFEHVVEQIEGLSLHSLSEEEGSGVRCIKPGFYETERAVRAGRRVNAEYRRGKTDCDPPDESRPAITARSS